MLDLHGIHIHYVGVGGVSMSALIRLARDYGAQVSGSDAKASPTLLALQREGLSVYQGVNAEVAKAADIVVYTSAVPLTHPELVVAKTKMERSEFLGWCAKSFPQVVAVAGTHGKTTCSAFLASILEAADIPFCAHIGGVVNAYGSGYHRTGDEVLVTEACEYRAHFLALTPSIGIITNVEYDHPDYYQTPKELEDAFGRFADQCDKLICPKGVECMREHLHKCKYDDMSIRQVDEGHWVYEDSCTRLHLSLPVWGAFNAQDACLAVRAARLLGATEDAIKLGVATYSGTSRRQQLLGYLYGTPVLTDYAHHPTEIRALLEGAQKRYGTLCVVFQPHTFSRTKGLMDEFATCFEGATTLYMLPTYGARETGDDAILVQLLLRIPLADKYLADKQKVSDLLRGRTRKYGAYLLVGAGDVNDVAGSLPLCD